MIFLIILVAAFCLCAAFIPMPNPLRVGLYIAAGIVVLIILLELLGAFPGDAVYIRWPRG
jgi:uncharacterized protein YhhL (DUF1145 family)